MVVQSIDAQYRKFRQDAKRARRIASETRVPVKLFRVVRVAITTSEIRGTPNLLALFGPLADETLAVLNRYRHWLVRDASNQKLYLVESVRVPENMHQTHYKWSHIHPFGEDGLKTYCRPPLQLDGGACDILIPTFTEEQQFRWIERVPDTLSPESILSMVERLSTNIAKRFD